MRLDEGAGRQVSEEVRHEVRGAHRAGLQRARAILNSYAAAYPALVERLLLEEVWDGDTSSSWRARPRARRSSLPGGHPSPGAARGESGEPVPVTGRRRRRGRADPRVKLVCQQCGDCQRIRFCCPEDLPSLAPECAATCCGALCVRHACAEALRHVASTTAHRNTGTCAAPPPIGRSIAAKGRGFPPMVVQEQQALRLSPEQRRFFDENGFLRVERLLARRNRAVEQRAEYRNADVDAGRAAAGKAPGVSNTSTPIRESESAALRHPRLHTTPPPTPAPWCSPSWWNPSPT